MSTSNFMVQPCPSHSNIQWTQFCCQGSGIKRVCGQCQDTNCKLHGQEHISRVNFIGSLYQNIDNLKILQEKIICRHTEIVQLATTFPQNYDRVDQQIYIQFQTSLHIEAEKYDKIYNKIEILRSQLSEIVRLYKYVRFMGDHQLYELRLNLSSSKGLRKFHQKVMRYREESNTKRQFDNLRNELQRQYQQLVTLDSSSLARQLNSFCWSKCNSRQPRCQNKSQKCLAELKTKAASSKSLKQLIK